MPSGTSKNIEFNGNYSLPHPYIQQSLHLYRSSDNVEHFDLKRREQKQKISVNESEGEISLFH
jgi:hypothetical protein